MQQIWMILKPLIFHLTIIKRINCYFLMISSCLKRFHFAFLLKTLEFLIYIAVFCFNFPFILLELNRTFNVTTFLGDHYVCNCKLF